MFLREELKYFLSYAIVAAGVGTGLVIGKVWGSVWPVAAFLSFVIMLVGYGVENKFLYWMAFFFAALGISLFSCCRSRAVLDRLTEIDAARPSVLQLRVEGEPRVTVGKDSQKWVSFPSTVADIKIKVVFSLNERMPGYGEIWTCRGWLSRENMFGTRRFFVKGQGAYAVYEKIDLWGWIMKKAFVLRQKMSRMLESGVSQSNYALGLCKAMILGEKKSFRRREREIFVNAGTIHVFAVSGLHVMIISGLLLFIPRLLFVPMRYTGLILVPLLFLYVAVVGFPPSAVRAFVMIAFYHLAPLFWRRSNALVAWSLAFITLSLYSPVMLLNVGAWFSFMVTLVLLIWTRISSDVATSSPMETLGVTLSTWLAGVPIAAFVFGKVSIGGLIANLVVVPLASVAVGSGLIGILFAGISTYIASHFNNLAVLTAHLMFTVSSMVSLCIPVLDNLGTWNLSLCILCYIGILVIGATIYFRLKQKPSLLQGDGALPRTP
jgi:ComEC/Rec2-related protein